MSKPSKIINQRLAACTFPIEVSAGAIQVFPAGEFALPRGAMMGDGPWYLDEAHAALVIAHVSRRANPLVIDYEHQSLLSRENGQPAPAAGWVSPASLVWRPDGLWATGVEWTENAAAMIAAGEYKFLSPVFSYDTDGYPTDLINIALTNNPAIDGLQPIMLAAARFNSALTLETPMDDLMERLCYLLNLPLTTTAQEMAAQLDKVKTLIAVEASEDATAAASGLIGLLAAKNQKIAALKSQTPDPSQYVPIAAMKESNEKLAMLMAKDQQREIDELVKPALADGRLLPTQEVWARELGVAHMAALKSFLDSSKPIAALKGMQTGGKPIEGTDPLQDGMAIAALATQYQTEQRAKGIEIDDIAAVLHVTKGA